MLFFCVGGRDAGDSYISRNFIIPIWGLFDQMLELVCPLCNRMGILGFPMGILGICQIPFNIFFLLIFRSYILGGQWLIRILRDGDYGDLSNPIRHFFAFFFLLIGKYYILIISTL